ncbi:lasso peptide biosynthesis B2 protein [Citrobacter sp. CtB7.12]|uniref:lasso peptide biosynthesis B2 protein n=1 Tax=Citrobacter sp. CtB7.12 TaxID=1696093 RepID=UPI0006BA62EE|nr:lasso peptide biosynthesis B2 protein [Citrobacter sp. CtB7.12]
MLIVPDTLKIARFCNDIIILDLLLDEYTVLENAADSFLLHHEIDPVIEDFLISDKRCQYLKPVSQETPEAFLEIRWMKPSADSQYSNIFSRMSAFMTLLICKRKLRRSGMMAVRHEFPNAGISGSRTSITSQVMTEITQEIASLNSVFDFISHENPCLIYSCTLRHRLRTRKIDAKVVIGVRTRPFFSHAWVEVDKTIISDDPGLREKASVILEY